jgi:hypothetical protein
MKLKKYHRNLEILNRLVQQNMYFEATWFKSWPSYKLTRLRILMVFLGLLMNARIGMGIKNEVKHKERGLGALPDIQGAFDKTSGEAIIWTTERHDAEPTICRWI